MSDVPNVLRQVRRRTAAVDAEPSPGSTHRLLGDLEQRRVPERPDAPETATPEPGRVGDGGSTVGSVGRQARPQDQPGERSRASQGPVGDVTRVRRLERSGGRLRSDHALVDAATKLFSRRGYRAVAVGDIAVEAGVTKMTLYRHFASKEALAAACVERIARAGSARHEAIARRQASDPLGQLRAIVAEAGAESRIAECWSWFLVDVAAESAEPSHPLRLMVEAHERRLRERIVALATAAGAPRPRALADALLLLLQGAVVTRRTLLAGDPAEILTDAFEDLLSARGLVARRSFDGAGRDPAPCPAARASPTET